MYGKSAETFCLSSNRKHFFKVQSVRIIIHNSKPPLRVHYHHHSPQADFWSHEPLAHYVKAFWRMSEMAKKIGLWVDKSTRQLTKLVWWVQKWSLGKKHTVRGKNLRGSSHLTLSWKALQVHDSFQQPPFLQIEQGKRSIGGRQSLCADYYTISAYPTGLMHSSSHISQWSLLPSSPSKRTHIQREWTATIVAKHCASLPEIKPVYFPHTASIPLDYLKMLYRF